MDLKPSPEYIEFRKEVKSFLKDNIDMAGKARNPARPNKNELDWQDKLIKNGYAARTIPKDYGGYGAEPDVLKSRIIAEEFTNAQIPLGMANQGISMFVPTLLELGTEDQKQSWIEKTIKGEVIWCQGYSEPGSGSDLASLQTKAVDDGDDFIINGQKIWTSSAQFSDMMFCLVRTEPDAPKHKGISYLLIPMDTPGIEIRPLVDMTLDAGFNEVFFTDVRIPATNIVGKRGQGWLVANKTLVHERGSLGDPAKMVSRFNKLVELMKTETIDGQRAIDKPVYRDRLMKIQGKVLALKAHGLRLLSARLNKGQDVALATMIVKLYGTEMRYELESLAIDVMGELGTLYEDSPHLRNGGGWQYAYMYYLGLIIGGGTSQIQKNIISERGLGMPKEPKVKEA